MKLNCDFPFYFQLMFLHLLTELFSLFLFRIHPSQYQFSGSIAAFVGIQYFIRFRFGDIEFRRVWLGGRNFESLLLPFLLIWIIVIKLLQFLFILFELFLKFSIFVRLLLQLFIRIFNILRQSFVDLWLSSGFFDDRFFPLGSLFRSHLLHQFVSWL